MTESEVLHPIRGITLLCSRQGIIQQIIANDLGLAAAHLVGQPLTALVAPNSVEPTQNLLASLTARHVVLDRQLDLPTAEGVVGMYVSAGMVGEQIFIAGTPSQLAAAAFFESLMQMNMDQSGRLTRELVTTQRELAKRKREVARLAKQNAQLYQDAEAALQLRNEFISSITHDLKTPLTTIKGYGQILRRRVSRLDLAEPEKLVGPLENIDATVQRMIEQIEGMLDLARLQKGASLTLNRSEIDLVALLQRVLKMLAPLMLKHRLEFTPTLPALIGWWDLLYLERMVTNIISNAIKYSAPGGLISISLILDASASPQQAIMQVCDQGLGIPDAEIARIFEPFYRAANSRERGIKGTGIGLASVRQIIDLHGGTISVTSEEHVGTCFTVELPIIPPVSQNGVD